MLLMDLKRELNKYDEGLPVIVQGDEFLCNSFGSDRGSYYDMYIEIFGECSKGEVIKSVKELKQLIQKAYEQEIMVGYKGGNFNIDDYTTVKVGHYGVGGNPVVQYIEEKDGKVVVGII